MQLANLTNLPRFSPDKMVKANVFATDRLFYDIYCLEPGQAQKIHSHAGSDKVYLVLTGRAVVSVGAEERELGPEEAALAAAGQPHGVRNDSPDRVTLLVVTTPPPA